MEHQSKHYDVSKCSLGQKAPHLVGKAPHLVGKAPHLVGKAPHLVGKAPHLVGKPTPWVGKSAFQKVLVLIAHIKPLFKCKCT